MKYGFVIDQRKCIGCHACTVACKAENEVPVGSFRTWVKYVDKGLFPSVRRHFTVLRCNHCDDAPCVEICPVNALHKRPDAIVDLDRDVCIGCRACMQACPYDALYLNGDTGTAEKCHYCAHRTEVGLEPACVIVCPEQAIVAGDVDAPGSAIATLIREQPVQQRKVEKGTRPRVWYVDALPEALVPGAPSQPPSYIWSDRAAPPPSLPPGMEGPADLLATLDVHHGKPWGWHIWLYLLTKNISAGAMLVAPFLSHLGADAPAGGLAGVVPELVALAFLGVTGALLVHDLGRPERFWRILLTPNPRSWLVKGTWFLAAFGALTAASLLLRLWASDAAASDVVRIANAPFALMSCVYTAFLFRQCRGRDLWLAGDIFWHLLAQALLMGAGVAALAGAGRLPARAETLFVILAAINGAWIALGVRHKLPTEDGRKAHALLYISGRPRIASLLLYGAALAMLAVPRSAPLEALGGGVRLFAVLLAAAALLVYEKAFIDAGQEIRNS